MGNETYKKRQKELARREKRQKKAARLLERKNEKVKPDSTLEEERSEPANSLLEPQEATKFGI
jgi:hypothetical protein